MFDRFRSAFPPTACSGGSPPTWSRTADVDGVAEFVRQWAGTTFSFGLYRVHDADGAAQAADAVARLFTDGVLRYQPFAMDWLGRQFALDVRSGDADGITLLEPGTAMALVIPSNFVSFHEGELVDNADAAVALHFFEEWRSASGGHELANSECVGYDVPLFLGGDDDVANLSVTDWRVYWDLTAQIYEQVRDLPPGTKISGVGIGDP